MARTSDRLVCSSRGFFLACVIVFIGPLHVGMALPRQACWPCWSRLMRLESLYQVVANGGSIFRGTASLDARAVSHSEPF
jgi:hypothetical protein